MKLISQSETERKFRICCETKLKRKSMENFFLCIGKHGKQFSINNIILTNFISIRVPATSSYQNNF